MLRQIAIFLLVPILTIPGIFPDDISPCSLSFVPAQLSPDSNYDPDRNIADAARTIVVQIILVITFLISSLYFIPRQELPVFSLGGRDPPFSR
ncbi:MAG: hypothetical protein ABFD62_06100 [Syntrophaceae bacterium]